MSIIFFNCQRNVKSEYVYGVNGMVAQMDADGRDNFFIKDHLNNTRQLSGANLRRDYFPFGEHYIASGDGTHYLGARYYDPSIGRWLSVDPAFNNWNTKRIMQYNLYNLSPYAYVRNNPLNRFDPDGYVDWPRVGLGALGVISGIFETGLGGTIAAGSSVTVMGALGGTALMMHGISTIGFGTAEIIAGLADSDQQIPGGPLEAVGKAVEQGTGIEVASEIGKALDLGIQVGSGGNSIKGLTKAGNLIPTSAKEAVQAGNYLLKVAKELTNVGSQAASTIQLEQTVEEIHKKKDKDDE